MRHFPKLPEVAKRLMTRAFTAEFPDRDYPPTTRSAQPQTSLWPAYLAADEDRLVVFERSKNAQLVVYAANFRDRERRELQPKWPIDIRWQSFGWTESPTSNATGAIERRLAWGYSHKPMAPDAAAPPGSRFHVTLNALPSRAAQLFFDDKGRLVLQTVIGGKTARLWKVYVKTNDSSAFIPKVLYVELYGNDVETGDDAYERIDVSS